MQQKPLQITDNCSFDQKGFKFFFFLKKKKRVIAEIAGYPTIILIQWGSFSAVGLENLMV